MKILHILFSIVIILFLAVGFTYSQSTAKDSYKKGIDYCINGEFEKAKSEFKKASKDDSLHTTAELNLKTIDDVLKKRIKRETGNHIFRAIQNDDQGKHAQAIDEFTKAIEINPDYADSYNKRGLVYYGQTKYEQAIKDYDLAIRINPKYTDAYNNRGIIYFEMEKYDLAISDYSKAIELDPKYAKAYHNRGLIYVTKLKNYDKGCSDWKKACELGECTNYKIAKEKGFCK
jgi:tetratricopeptide (TPR) repeat protein